MEFIKCQYVGNPTIRIPSEWQGYIPEVLGCSAPCSVLWQVGDKAVLEGMGLSPHVIGISAKGRARSRQCLRLFWGEKVVYATEDMREPITVMHMHAFKISLTHTYMCKN